MFTRIDHIMIAVAVERVAAVVGGERDRDALRRDLVQHILLVTLSNLGPASTTDPICEALSAFVGRMNWSGATPPG